MPKMRENFKFLLCVKSTEKKIAFATITKTIMFGWFTSKIKRILLENRKYLTGKSARVSKIETDCKKMWIIIIISHKGEQR